MAIVSIPVDRADTAFSRLLSRINQRMLVRDGSELQELDRGDGTSALSRVRALIRHQRASQS